MVEKPTVPDMPTEHPPAPPRREEPPDPELTATEIIGRLDDTLGKVREEQILAFALAGDVPCFLRSWVEVPTSAKIDGRVVTGTIFVLPDYFCLGTDEDFVRVPMNPLTAQTIGDDFDAQLPTRKIVNLIHQDAACRIPAQTMDYHGPMLSTAYFVENNRSIELERAKKKCPLGALVSGCKKDVVVGAALANAPGRVGIYGWFDGDSINSVIQGPTINFSTHEITYADYSHGIRFVRKTMVVDGNVVRLDDVLTDPKLCVLVSDEGALTKTRYG